MPSLKQRKVAIVGSRSVGTSERKKQNEAHDMASSLSIPASPPLQHNTWLPDARQIIARCAVRWRSLRGELLPDDRKHFQQDYTVERPGFFDGNRRHRWTGRHRGRAIRSSQPSAYRLYVTQDEYSILNSKHFIGIHGYMLVYSVSSLPSFEMVQVVREKILNHLVGAHLPPQRPSMTERPPLTHMPWNHAQGTESVPIVIVGNKSDLRPEQRQVSPEEGKKLSEKFQCGWTEASARYNQNVGRAFELLIGEIEKSQSPGEPPAKSNCLLM